MSNNSLDSVEDQFDADEDGPAAACQWLKSKLTSIQLANQSIHPVQAVSDEYCSHFGLQRMHATTFREKVALPKNIDSDTPRYERALREYGYEPGTTFLIAQTFVRLCDAARHLPRQAHPDLAYAFGDLRPSEWLNLINILVSEDVGRVHVGLLLKKKVREAAATIVKGERHNLIFKDWADRRHSSNTYQQRAAGGTRFVGGAIPSHLVATKSLVRAIIPGDIEDSRLYADIWVEVPFLLPPIEQDIKVEIGISCQAAKATLEQSLLSSRPYCRDECIRVSGTACCGWCPS